MRGATFDDLALFRADGCVLVEARGKPYKADGHVKVQCYKPTGGRHGLLKLRNLTPVNDKAREMAAKALG